LRIPQAHAACEVGAGDRNDNVPVTYVATRSGVTLESTG